MKKAFSTRLFTFGLVAGAFALVAFSVHAVYAPEISGWYLETTYSDAAVAGVCVHWPGGRRAAFYWRSSDETERSSSPVTWA